MFIIPVFFLFTNSDQYSLQILLCQTDVSRFPKLKVNRNVSDHAKVGKVHIFQVLSLSQI